MKRWYKGIAWAGGVLLVLILTIPLVANLMNEPLRTFFESRINRNLKGYRAHLADVDLNPFDLTLVLQGVTLIQNRHPEPPVARFETIDFGLHWRALLSARIVGDVELRRPQLHINLNQLRQEAGDEAEIHEKGWQDAVKAIYPLEINLLKVEAGEITYIDEDPRHPLEARQITIEASNIRNVADPEATFPSPVWIEATVFEKGKLKVNGKADFLSEPIVSLAVDVALEEIPLNRFEPVLRRYHVALEAGRLDAAGRLEITPKVRSAHLKVLELQGVKADYVHTRQASPEAREAAEKTGQAAKEVSNNPKFQLRVDSLTLHGEIGMLNRTTEPNYRVYVSDADLRLDNLSNHFSQGPAQFTVSGAFMGSGRTRITGAFRPENQGPDFDMNVTIEGTRMKAMNDLFRAYGNFDVNAGLFSIYSELKVKNDTIDGYVKPFFKDVDVYDRRQDEEKSVFRKMYEGLVEGVNDLLSRDPQDRTAARTDLSGKVENPKADTWQTLVTLIQNAFFRAILPGFDRAISE